MPETMNSEYHQTESLDCPPRKLRILEKSDGFSQDPDVVRLTLTIIFYLDYPVQGNDNSCLENIVGVWLKNIHKMKMY